MKRVGLLMLVVAVLGCEPGKAPLTGTYVLRTIGGDSLPAKWILAGPETVLADTLIFEVVLGAKHTNQVEHRFAQREIDGRVLTGSSHEWYTIENGVITLTFDCPPGYDCIYLPNSAAMRGDTIVRTWTNPSYRERIYVRIPAKK